MLNWSHDDWGLWIWLGAFETICIREPFIIQYPGYNHRFVVHHRWNKMFQVPERLEVLKGMDIKNIQSGFDWVCGSNMRTEEWLWLAEILFWFPDNFKEWLTLPRIIQTQQIRYSVFSINISSQIMILYNLWISADVWVCSLTNHKIIYKRWPAMCS